MPSAEKWGALLAGSRCASLRGSILAFQEYFETRDEATLDAIASTTRDDGAPLSRRPTNFLETATSEDQSGAHLAGSASGGMTRPGAVRMASGIQS